VTGLPGPARYSFIHVVGHGRGAAQVEGYGDKVVAGLWGDDRGIKRRSGIGTECRV